MGSGVGEGGRDSGRGISILPWEFNFEFQGSLY